MARLRVRCNSIPTKCADECNAVFLGCLTQDTDRYSGARKNANRLVAGKPWHQSLRLKRVHGHEPI